MTLRNYLIRYYDVSGQEYTLTYVQPDEGDKLDPKAEVARRFAKSLPEEMRTRITVREIAYVDDRPTEYRIETPLDVIPIVTETRFDNSGR